MVIPTKTFQISRPNHEIATAALTFWNSEDMPDDEEDEDNEDSESEWMPSKGG